MDDLICNYAGVATASRTAASTAKLGTAGGSPGRKGRKRGPKPRGDGDDKQKRLDARKRPGWWEPYVKGSHRTVLSLRPADALPGAVRGESGVVVVVVVVVLVVVVVVLVVLIFWSWWCCCCCCCRWLLLFCADAPITAAACSAHRLRMRGADTNVGDFSSRKVSVPFVSSCAPVRLYDK